MIDSRARYERLIQDLRADLRPQRQWGEGRGIFLVIGHFVVGVAGGAWLVSLVFASRAGLAAAFLLAALGGVSHLAFLGHPERFWRMVSRVKTSWISRGFAGLSLFLAGGFLYLTPMFLPAAPWGGDSILASAGFALAFLGMIVLIGYMGFVYAASKAIPFWNSPLHPLLYIGHALRGGVAALLVIAALGGEESARANELLWMWVGSTSAVAVLFALELHAAATGGNAAARRSVRELLAGRMAFLFYAGTLAVGVAVPAGLALGGLSSPLSLAALAAIGVASAAGDFFMKYSTIRAGVHLPVWGRATAQRW